GHEVLRPRPHVPGHDRVRAGPLRRRRDRRRPRLRRPRGPHAPGDRSLRRLGPVRHPRRPAGRRRRLLRGSGTPPPAARRPRGGGHAHRGRTGGRLLRLVTDTVSSGRSPYALANATGGAPSPPGVTTSGSWATSSSTPRSTANQPAASSSTSSTTSSRKPPGTSASWPPASTASVTPARPSTA